MYLYRGDDRKPDDVFKFGFVSRVCNEEYWKEVAPSDEVIDARWWAKPLVRPCPHYDFDTNFSLCLTANPLVAAFFPLKKLDDTYIYVIDAGQLGGELVWLKDHQEGEKKKIELELLKGWDEPIKPPQGYYPPPHKEAFLEAAMKRNEKCQECAVKFARGHSIAAVIPIHRDVAKLARQWSVSFTPQKLETNPRYASKFDPADLGQLNVVVPNTGVAQKTSVPVVLPSEILPKKRENAKKKSTQTTSKPRFYDL